MNCKVDLKEMFELKSDTQKFEFAKDLSAIANTPGRRGFLVYGVTKDGTVVGISPSKFNEEQMQQVISSKCDPPVKFSAYTLRHSGHHIGVIEIPHSIYRPHQHLLRSNFFIRRGTITECMSVQEISSAIIRKREIEKYALGTYDSSTPGYRIQQIKKDIIDIFDEFDYKNSRETQESFPTHGAGIKTVVDTEIENSKEKIRFHVSVYGDTVTYYDIERNRYVIRRVSDNFKIRKNTIPWLNIFLIASYDPISVNTIKGRYQSDHLITFTTLDGSTFYYGLGDVDYQGVRTSNNIVSKRRFLPEFYLNRVRSKEDVTTRLSIIFDYINEKSDIFKIIRNSQSRPRKI